MITAEQRQRWLAAAQDITQAYHVSMDRKASESRAFRSTLLAAYDSPCPNDRLYGRVAWPPVGVSPEPGGLGWFCDLARVRDLMTSATSTSEREAWQGIATTWQSTTTADHIRTSAPSNAAGCLPTTTPGYVGPDAAFGLIRCAGLQLNHRRLLSEGLPGLAALVSERATQAHAAGDTEALACCAGWLEILASYRTCLDHAARQAEVLARNLKPGSAQANAAAMAADCRHLQHAPPRTVAQATQLIWLWDSGCGVLNHGRIDDSLAPFAGSCSDAEIESVCRTWFDLIAARHTTYNGRVCIGGRGRRDTNNANRIARCVLHLCQRRTAIEPQVSLRLDQDDPTDLFELALNAIGSGSTYPILYWDENVIPAIANSYRVSHATATSYLPYGCGEIGLGHHTIAAPNAIANIARILQETICGLPAGSAAPLSRAGPTFTTLEELWEAFCERLDLSMAGCAAWQAHTYAAAANECRLLAPSLLLGDCLERGRGALDGGITHRGGTMEAYGLIDTADSFAALEAITTAGHATIDEIRTALADDFVGHESLQARARHAPAFGNDDQRADWWAERVHTAVCAACSRHARANGLDHFLVVVINNWVNTVLGRHTAALPTGRRAGQPLTNAINPQAQRADNGPLACLRSLSHISHRKDAGGVHNLRLNPTWFSDHRQALRALLASYAANGGTQVMITTTTAEDLHAAQRNPAEWPHLMVRVGGFSARFIDLPADCQQEIITRAGW